MRVVQAGYEILDTLNGEEILKKIERVARVCYKSEDKIGEGTAERMVKALIKRGHEGEITVIKPLYLSDCGEDYNLWRKACVVAEKQYLDMLAYRFSPQEARAVLPNSLKTEVVMTANLREWRHFFSLRACGTTGKPHPQMLEVAVPLLKEVKSLIPVVFDDLEPLES